MTGRTLFGQTFTRNRAITAESAEDAERNKVLMKKARGIWILVALMANLNVTDMEALCSIRKKSDPAKRGTLHSPL